MFVPDIIDSWQLPSALLAIQPSRPTDEFVMEQLDHYLERLVSTSGYELRLEPNVNPYVISASGNADVGVVPLQGSQISMMVFPIIPADVKQDLPNQPQVQFVHPSNLGEFSFTVQKSAAGFNVSVKPLRTNGNASETPEVPVSQPKAVPDADVESPQPPSIEIPAATSYPPIDLQPIEEPAQVPPAPDGSFESFSPQTSIPEIERNEPAPQQSTVPSTFGELSVEDLQPAPVFEPANQSPPSSEPPVETFLPAEEVVQNAVTDRRSGERRATNSVMRDRMETLFRSMADAGASDLHLSVGMPPMVRKDGRMQKLECAEGVLGEDLMKELLHSIMPERNKEEFAERRDSDFAYEIAGLARFRSNIFMDRKGMAAVFRIIPSKMTTAEQLGLSKAIMGLCDLSKGLVVVTGPTGSGKSTTLCAMVNHINQSREDHIITIEDPVEFVHENINCLVNQREVHNHTMSFKDALRAALREDPDIILVGEMRDLETISIAIETAETGHLVFGTLHTTTAVSTVDRIIDQFPADRQQQVRVMLSESLKGVVAQTLLPKKGGGRVAALEVLIVTPAISNLIREGKTFQIASAMQTGKANGMVMLNDALFDLVQKDIVEPRDAYLKAVDKTGFEAMLTKGGHKI